ncbi:MAG: polysaccharide deacetylase family protein [Thermoleophilia bacterium]|nr:polysaccharide deacetylase family protein [Thermoleophilia bacterium]
MSDPQHRRRIACAACTAAALLAAGCGGGHDAPQPVPTRSAAEVPPAPPPARPAGPRVRWHGPVEHLFVHPLVTRPSIAFHGAQGRGFRDYFITTGEFRRMLAQMYSRGWVLADIERAASGRLTVPRGRRPVILSVDDLNYYGYMRASGFGERLEIAPDGRVAVRDHGRDVRNDVVPVLDDFVAAHQDFAIDGAKGVIAVTGYEGLLGERTQDASAPDIAARRARVRRVVARMRATGWRFASHSWGHLDHATASAARIEADAERWRTQVEPLTGPTDVYVYPFGAAPSDGVRAVLYRRFGFRIFCTIDVRPVLKRTDGVVVVARRHVDGLAFDGQRANLRRFFDVGDVEDRAARR